MENMSAVRRESRRRLPATVGSLLSRDPGREAGGGPALSHLCQGAAPQEPRTSMGQLSCGCQGPRETLVCTSSIRSRTPAQALGQPSQINIRSRITVLFEWRLCARRCTGPSRQLYAVNAITVPHCVPTFIITTLLRYNLRASVSLTSLCNCHHYLVVECCPPPGRNPGLSSQSSPLPSTPSLKRPLILIPSDPEKVQAQRGTVT